MPPKGGKAGAPPQTPVPPKGGKAGAPPPKVKVGGPPAPKGKGQAVPKSAKAKVMAKAVVPTPIVSSSDDDDDKPMVDATGKVQTLKRPSAAVPGDEIVPAEKKQRVIDTFTHPHTHTHITCIPYEIHVVCMVRLMFIYEHMPTTYTQPVKHLTMDTNGGRTKTYIYICPIYR